MKILRTKAHKLLDKMRENITDEIRPYKPLCITGGSGSGKTTLAKYIVEQKPHIYDRSTSMTTRILRDDEIEGKDYFRVTEDVFDATPMLECNTFFSNGKRYGTLVSEVERISAAKKRAVFDVDPNGAKELKFLYEKELLWVHLSVSVSVLEERLRKRAKNSEASILNRLKTAEQEHELIREGVFKPDRIIVYDDMSTYAGYERIMSFMNVPVI